MLLRRSKKIGKRNTGQGRFLTARRTYITIRTVAVLAAVYWVGGAREFDAMARELTLAVKTVSEQIEQHGKDTAPSQISKGSIDAKND